eukprot:14360097-Alexandrium_andersonii.AAC.1
MRRGTARRPTGLSTSRASSRPRLTWSPRRPRPMARTAWPSPSATPSFSRTKLLRPSAPPSARTGPPAARTTTTKR